MTSDETTCDETRHETTCDETREEQTPEASEAEVLQSASTSFALPPQLKAAREQLQRWLNETGEVTRRHWTHAMGRAKTRLDAADAKARQAGAGVEAELQDGVAALETLEGRANAWVPRLLEGFQTRVQAPLAKAQVKGAALLLGSVRRVRRQIEVLESNLEAARPPVELEVVGVA